MHACVVALESRIREEFPTYRTVRKRDSRLMRLLGLFAGRAFNRSFPTTIGYTVYLPDDWDVWPTEVKCCLLRHELVHMRQARRLTVPVFIVLYALVLLPVGLALFRYLFEREGYAEQLRAFKEYGMDYRSAERRGRFVSYLTGPAYGFAWPFKGAVGAWFDRTVAALDAEPIAYLAA